MLDLAGSAAQAVSRQLARLSCLVLVAIVLLTVTDTALRYLFNAPIAGSNEMVEIMLSFLIMLALPVCTVNRAHVTVDLLDGMLGRTGRRIADIINGGLALILLFFLSKRCMDKAGDALEFGDATIYLGFPQWPIYATISAAGAMVGLILLLQTIPALLGKTSDERD